MKAKRKAHGWIENAKEKAALAAVEHVSDNYVVGLGSGTTAAYAIKEIGKLIRREGWRILGVPTSHQAFSLAAECGIQATTLLEHPRLDLTVDGADQVDRDLNMIKGMGGALAREKIVASNSEQNVIVIDETKLVERLGMNHPVPVEVLPFAASVVNHKIRKIGGKPILRQAEAKVGPVVTDNCNFILDVHFRSIEDASKLDLQLKSIPGVVETGLFIGMADVVYVGKRMTVEKLQRK